MIEKEKLENLRGLEKDYWIIFFSGFYICTLLYTSNNVNNLKFINRDATLYLEHVRVSVCFCDFRHHLSWRVGGPGTASGITILSLRSTG